MGEGAGVVPGALGGPGEALGRGLGGLGGGRGVAGPLVPVGPIDPYWFHFLHFVLWIRTYLWPWAICWYIVLRPSHNGAWAWSMQHGTAEREHKATQIGQLTPLQLQDHEIDRSRFANQIPPSMITLDSRKS